MGSLGLDLWSGLTNIDSTNYAPGPSGQSVPWWQQAIGIGVDIYNRSTGQGAYSNNPPYPGSVWNTSTGQYNYPAQPAQTNWVPWLVVGGVILFALSKKRR